MLKSVLEHTYQTGANRLYFHIRVCDSLSCGINGQNKTAINRQYFWSYILGHTSQ